MKKLRGALLVALVCLLSVGVLAGCTKAEPAEQSQAATKAAAPDWASDLITPGGTKVIIGADTNYPPFESAKKDGSGFEGFDVDLMNAIGEKLNLTFEFKTYNFDSLVAGLNTGSDFDMVTSAWTINEERAKQVNFSTPYYRNDFGVVVSNDSKIASLGDLKKGDIVSVQTGSSAHEWAKKEFKGKGIELKTFENTLDCFNALTAGDADMVIQDIAMAADVVKDPARNAKVIQDISVDEFFGMGFAQNAKGEAMRDSINKALDEVVVDGTYAQIYKKWFGVDPTYLPKAQ